MQSRKTEDRVEPVRDTDQSDIGSSRGKIIYTGPTARQVLIFNLVGWCVIIAIGYWLMK